MLEELLKVFGLETKRDDLIMRVSDLSKTVTGSLNELNNLAVMTDVINKKQLEEVFRDVQVNTKVLVDASKAAERASKSLEVMQVVISASMAFDLIDRFTGFNQGIDTEGVPWMDFITQNLIYPPGVWFGFNARPSPIPSHAPSSHAQGSSGVVATVLLVWRGHTKSTTARSGPGPDLAMWLE